ncbi:hypothetical protein E4U54_002088 [Claviceps lovelessii]|nr:hypothetical protein E4U54_002088 [Claviceps lovelessii]
MDGGTPSSYPVAPVAWPCKSSRRHPFRASQATTSPCAFSRAFNPFKLHKFIIENPFRVRVAEGDKCNRRLTAVFDSNPGP